MSDRWIEEEVYQTGEEYYAALARALTSAQATVDLETYIFDRDPQGEQVLASLRAAAERGVRVRLLLDGVGCSGWTREDAERIANEGIETRFYHPLPWQNESYRWTRFLTIRKIAAGLWKLNRRNHRKACIVDGDVAFLGGMNVSARHSGRYSGADAWRDTSVRVRGSAVKDLARAFEATWSHPKGRELRWEAGGSTGPDPSLLRLNLTQTQRKAAYRELVLRIIGSKKRVWVTTPYFVPDLSLVRALRFAAWNSVDVRLLLPRQLDVRGLRWVSGMYYLVLLSAGVRIFEYLPSILHAKTLLVDDWATVGSTNLNHRSLLTDLEADVVLSHPGTLELLERHFLQDLERSEEIRPTRWRRGPWIMRGIEKLALLFRRWL